MKTLFIIFVIALFGCTKQPTKPSIYGTWSGSVGLFASVTITPDSFGFLNEPKQRILLSKDSIYMIFYDGSMMAEYGYQFTCNSLKLMPVLNHPDAPFCYAR